MRVIFILILGLLFPLQAQTTSEVLVEKPEDKIKKLIYQTELKYHISHGLLNALARAESNHNSKAFVKSDGKSGKSSYGLFQIQLGTARQMGFKGTAKELMEPANNIEYAAKYFRWLLTIKNNDYAKALSCYNAGHASYVCKTKDTYSSKYVALVLNSVFRR